MLKRFGSIIASIALTSAIATPALAIEEPGFTVERRLSDGVEIRAYTPYVVAEVRVEAPAEEAASQAFPILAGYIFGKNKGERTMAMTAPVTQTPAPTGTQPAEPLKLAMTAPVTQTPTDGGYRVQFVLPSDVSLASAPEPLDPRVTLREEPAQRLAVVRYRGFWSDANYREHLTRLQDALRAEGLVWRGEPVFSRYDPPITPWFLRRNEIWLALE